MAINNYNRGSVQEQVDRVQTLMGIKKNLTETKTTAPLGNIEKIQIGKDGMCYAVIKENNKYYLKKSSVTTDVKLNDFEYLGGSHRYKHLYEFGSYNNAEKILVEHLFNVSKDVKKQIILDEQAEKVDMNMSQTVTSKNMRNEINRQREIMSNASAILNEDSGIRQNKKKLNELSIEDEEILTDGDNEETISLDAEIGDGDVDTGDVDLGDSEMGDDVDLDKQDVELDQDLVNLIPQLLDKMDDLNSQLSQLTQDEDDEFNIDGFEDDDEIEIEESIVTESDSNFDNMASDVTKKQFDYQNVEEDPRGRNELPDLDKNGNIGVENMHTDTLDDIKGTCPKSTDMVEETQEFEWDLKGEGGENIADHDGDVIKHDKFTAKTSFKENKLYVVERDGTVKGVINTNDFKSMLNGKQPKGGNNPSKPFDKKVQEITDKIFNECVQSGIFKIKK